VAFEGLEAFARARIPDLDGAIIRCRRQPLVVVRERYGPDPAVVAFEGLEAETPIIWHKRLGRNPFWLLLLE